MTKIASGGGVLPDMWHILLSLWCTSIERSSLFQIKKKKKKKKKRRNQCTIILAKTSAAVATLSNRWAVNTSLNLDTCWGRTVFEHDLEKEWKQLFCSVQMPLGVTFLFCIFWPFPFPFLALNCSSFLKLSDPIWIVSPELLPWPKKLRQPLALGFKRVLSRACTRLYFSMRGCLNFFGQGSSSVTLRIAWLKTLVMNHVLTHNRNCVDSPGRVMFRHRHDWQLRKNSTFRSWASSGRNKFKSWQSGWIFPVLSIMSMYGLTSS